LTLLEHLIKNGSERCVDDARNHSHTLRSLFNFNYYEGTVDRGVGVREKAKQIVEMLGDDERVREERTKARQLREKFGASLGGVSSTSGGRYAGYGNEDYGRGGGGGDYGNSGIGSSSSGFRDEGASGYGGSHERGYSGRYSDPATSGDSIVGGGVGATRSSSSSILDAETTPHFASIPDKKERKVKKSKKKKDKTDDSDEQSAVPASKLKFFNTLYAFGLLFIVFFVFCSHRFV